jgi:hypothetical protein
MTISATQETKRRIMVLGGENLLRPKWTIVPCLWMRSSTVAVAVAMATTAKRVGAVVSKQQLQQ